MAGSADVARPSTQVQMYVDHNSGRVRWRALGGNRRELARSTDEFPDIETCLVSIRTLIGAADELTARVEARGLSQWTWIVERDGMAVATAAFGFDRRTRCAESSRRFVSTLAQATVLPGLLANRHRGSVGHGGHADALEPA